MDPLESGDTGGLGIAIDGLTNSVKSAQRFADTVNEVTQFELVLPIIWALVALAFFARVTAMARPWNEGAARRWTETGRVLGPRTAAAYETEIAELRRIVAEQGARLAELVGAEQPAPASPPALHVVSAKEK